MPVFDEFEEKLARMVWRTRPKFAPSGTMLSGASSFLDEKSGATSGTLGMVVEQYSKELPSEDAPDPRVAKQEKRDKSGFWSWKLSDDSNKDKRADPEAVVGAKRPSKLYAPIYSGIACALAICTSCDRDNHLTWYSHFPSLMQSSSVLVSRSWSRSPCSTTNTPGSRYSPLRPS